MQLLLLILPALAHVLMAAHLLFHGFGPLISALPLVPLLFLFIGRPWAARITQALLFLWGIEWLRTAWAIAEARMAAGAPWMRAALIVAACALFSWLCAAVFRSARIRKRFRMDPLS